MKFQTLAALFAATASAASPPVCKPQSPQCKYVPKQSAQVCQQLIQKKKIHLSTCEAPAKTVKSTRFVRPTVYVTKTINPPAVIQKVSTTTTKTGAPHTQPTTTITATSTEVVGTLVTDTTTLTEHDTITNTDTETETNTATITTTSTNTVSWTRATCTEVFKKRSGYALPAECSCFATTTKACQSNKTKIVTVTKPAATQTVYKKNTHTATVTWTIAVTRYADGVTLSAPETTTTLVKTSTSTAHTLTTETDTETITSSDTITETLTAVSTDVATATATTDPCANVAQFLLTTKPSHPNVVLGGISDGNGVQSCCGNCFRNSNCAYFSYQTSPYPLCKTYSVSYTVNLGCTSAKCPRGFAQLTDDTTTDPLATYYEGQCGSK
ncbi:hypothetical protein AK830_g10890 [Neonectria ditissima]|uniref:Apple domain-containing protein n=1 Tax=Neonectria ditissima TaxID=78410 RepID=A0A0P7AEN0_9HYPO|nr:hypothetical protein AK830_g10890 [Neonectria ditissima]